jgi:DNA invertase Pin-like site-specific DNA recombinase
MPGRDAQAAGVYKGRPARLDWSRVAALRAAGQGATQIARELGCSRAMVYKALKGQAGLAG